MSSHGRAPEIAEPKITAAPLKRCRIYYMAAGQDVSWGWRSEDGRAKSRDLFPLFFECVENARENGYYADLERHPEDLIRAVPAGGPRGTRAPQPG